MSNLCSTQFNLPDLGFRDLAKSIPDAYIYDEEENTGREDEPHLTALFGITENNPEKVRRLIERHNIGPITVTLGKLELFENEKFNVLKVHVEGPELHKLHYLLEDNLPNENKYPDYNPHITIAYLQPDKGKAWEGDRQFEGKRITLTNLLFSDPNRKKTQIPLKGNSKSMDKDLVKQAAARMLEKIAVTPNQLLKGVKKTDIPIFKPPLRTLPETKDFLGNTRKIIEGPHARQAYKNKPKGAKKLIEKQIKEVPEDVRGAFAAIAKPKQDAMYFPTGKNQDSVKYLQDAMGKKPMKSPKDNKAMQAIVKAHERDEIVSMRKGQDIGMTPFGHASPEVILKEHNNLTTMKGADKAVDRMRELRRGGEADFIEEALGGNFEFGKSPRLSRHARKNITKIVNKKMEKQLPMSQVEEFNKAFKG